LRFEASTIPTGSIREVLRRLGNDVWKHDMSNHANLNALLAAGASGVYLSGGFGLWELIFPVLVMPVVVGLRSYPFIGVAWLMHAGWDVVHHLYGNAIWAPGRVVVPES
jgi:hypothetical protein